MTAMRRLVPAISALALTLCSASVCALEGGTLTVPANGVIGVDDAMLASDFWIRRLGDADRIVLDDKAIAAENAALVQKDPTLHDLQALPATLMRKQVTDWINAMSERPSKPMYDADNAELSSAALDALIANVDLASVAEQTQARYALVVHRADPRTFPTTLRAFSERNNSNIDRFQESALFPGTPVVVVHASRDGKWRFVISPRYAAWVESRFLAEGPAALVFGYADAKPYRIVTGATVTTVYSPTQAAISQLQLDMGVRVPL